MSKRFYMCLLILLTAVRLQADIDTKEFEAIASIIDKYLNNKVDAAEEEALETTSRIAEKKGDTNATSVLITDYLSGNMSVTPELLLIASEKKPSEAALAYISIFVRKVASDIRLNQDEMLFYLDNYLKAQESSSSPSVKKWAAGAQTWKNWCSNSFQLRAGMPRLLASKVSTPLSANIKESIKNITSTSLEEFTKSREIFKKRPCPKSLDFTKNLLQSYIDSLPDTKTKKDEIKRMGVVKGLKTYLIKLLAKTPYQGQIKLKSGKYNGAISMANENVIVIMKKGATKSEAFGWKEVPMEQIIVLVEYFADIRLKGTGAFVSPAERARHAAQEYLQLAFFLDWFGNYSGALKYIKKAVELSPDASKDAIFLVKGSQPNPSS
ncbi:MAG: hypothetical protein A2020_09640 [Lentisphaerae bacterium GWF2_45_14]|nr:MAG: hypothetical protein A2020_09640 [Lentisphaerae bacterium GWF2_45_14]